MNAVQSRGYPYLLADRLAYAFAKNAEHPRTTQCHGDLRFRSQRFDEQDLGRYARGIKGEVLRSDAVSRPFSRKSGGSGRQWQPEQPMTRHEAVRAFTTWAAYAAFEEAVAGSIEPGKRADLVVLDDDPFTSDEMAIADIGVAMTIVAGEVVFRSPQ